MPSIWQCCYCFQELKEAFVREAEDLNEERLILSVSIWAAAGNIAIDLYDVDTINKYLGWPASFSDISLIENRVWVLELSIFGLQTCWLHKSSRLRLRSYFNKAETLCSSVPSSKPNKRSLPVTIQRRK